MMANSGPHSPVQQTGLDPTSNPIMSSKYKQNKIFLDIFTFISFLKKQVIFRI